MKINGFKVVRVTWLDSSGANGWNRIDDDDCLSRIESVGILARKTKDNITISCSCTENNNWHGALTIPRFAITKLKYL